MQQRTQLDSYDYFTQRLQSDDIMMVMKKAGVPVPETTDMHNFYPEKDELSDQMNLTQILLFLEGNNPYAYNKAQCPHCKSKMAAGICYNIYAGKVQLDNKVHMPTEKDPLTYYDNEAAINLSNEDSLKNRPAYVCLQCGDYFGEFKLSKSQIWKYRKDFNVKYS